jgi:hypothetical protein
MPGPEAIPTSAGRRDNHVFTQINGVVLLQFSMCDIHLAAHGNSYDLAILADGQHHPRSSVISMPLHDMKRFVSEADWKTLLNKLSTLATHESVTIKQVYNILGLDSALGLLNKAGAYTRALRLFGVCGRL